MMWHLSQHIFIHSCSGCRQGRLLLSVLSGVWPSAGQAAVGPQHRLSVRHSKQSPCFSATLTGSGSRLSDLAYRSSKVIDYSCISLIALSNGQGRYHLLPQHSLFRPLSVQPRATAHFTGMEQYASIHTLCTDTDHLLLKAEYVLVLIVLHQPLSQLGCLS